ncbi:uncharacterized protein CD98hc [Chironomus tepperi]|uniref:uncharacterized protein CD98hc n=1 Tax=Chironomus tepperi TaxID=113505 RepID=UPI00391F309C
MSEEKLTSNKLDIEQKRQSLNNSEDNRESYKPISEDTGLDHVSGDTAKNSNMVRENLNAQDGADEKMLGTDDKETLALKDVEVKFIAADPNGDAKIEIETAEKTFTGMTKEELMKYANDPFWVKLRWFMFILFWAAWIGMLVGAVLIIINAPKCAPPTPLPWYKEGPLVLIGNNANSVDVEQLAKHEVQGVIYELDGDKTYKIDDVQNDIKIIVDKFKAKNIHVVIDLTPNYVTSDDELLKKALGGDIESQAAFVTSDKKTNFKKVKEGGDAWEDQGNNKYYLKQFGTNYDLRLDNALAQDKFKGVLAKLAEVGVKGFRLSNAKHFIIKEGVFQDNAVVPDPHGLGVDEYLFYVNSQTTFQKGLGQLLHDLNSYVKNITNDEGFLTIKDDLSAHMKDYAVGEFLGFELPRFGFINSIFHSPDATKAKILKDNFDKIHEHLSSDSTKWMQIEYGKHAYENFDESAFKLFIGLLNGVQIASFNDLVNINNNTDLYTKIQKEHETTVFQHGSFESYLSEDATAFAYSRMKSGNPGYFVVVNPSNNKITAKFNETSVLGSDLTFVMFSNNFDEPPKNKVKLSEIEMPKQSTAIFTFVPK